MSIDTEKITELECPEDIGALVVGDRIEGELADEWEHNFICAGPSPYDNSSQMIVPNNIRAKVYFLDPKYIIVESGRVKERNDKPCRVIERGAFTEKLFELIDERLQKA